MAEAEFWAELLKEARNASSQDPQISAKTAALVESGWMQELTGKIDVPLLDSSGKVTQVPSQASRAQPAVPAGDGAPKDLATALDVLAEAGVPSLRDLVRDLDELFAELADQGIQLSES
jgi:hypothetical protein